MAYISGLMLIDCPASALNNAGNFMEMERRNNYENWTAIKKIRTKEGVFPYVSAQAFRCWLRESLLSVPGWTASPTYREEKVAYTDANPILYAEDDLFGYMRAPGGSTKDDARLKRSQWSSKGLTDQESKSDPKTEKFSALTRSSPFRTSTLISIAGMNSSAVGYDYGNMARHEGDPVPIEHEFYRTTLVGLFSVDLRMLGRFYHQDRTGYKHLDSIRQQMAQAKGLTPYDNGRAYELASETRKERLKQLLQGLTRIVGGAKQALHYTPVNPQFLMMGVAKGGNHLFGTAISAQKNGLPQFNFAAIEEVARVFRGDLLSRFYVGLMQGYLDDQRESLRATLARLIFPSAIQHPVEAVDGLIEDLEARKEIWLK